MAGYLRRFTEIPTIEVIKEIEGVVIIDLAPPDPATGAGSGTVLLVGEFDDGFFATDEEIKGSLEIYGSEDFRQKFGSFGYTYDQIPSQNPSARRRMSELWNGNGWLKAFKLRARRILVARVDTSVGSVSFDPLASISGGQGPFVLTVGDVLTVTTDQGTASSTAIAAAVATEAGAAAAFGSIVSGDTFGIRIDGGPQINVTFGGADTTQAAVLARINATLGFACAVINLTQIDLRGIVVGTNGSVELIQVTPGVLAKIGHVVGVTNGTGTVGNLNAVTADEMVTIINGTAGLTAIQVEADKGPGGELRVSNNVAATVSTIEVDSAGPLGSKLQFDPLDTTVSMTGHSGGQIRAGTRVRTAGGLEWVTMQTLDVPAGAVGPFVAKVRPAFDDGTAAGTGAGTVTVLVDAASFATLTVNNPGPLTAALTEAQMDNAYAVAMERTLDESGPAREANYLLSARRSDAVVRDGRANVIKATECGLFARKFVTGDPLGTTTDQIIANVAQYRHDRVFYVGKGLKVRIPQIAERGEAGGLGFTADGVITVRPDGPLTTLCALLAPEENPGQQTGLIDDFFAVDPFGEVLTIDSYKAYKRNGVAVPRADRISGMVFQSGVTSSLQSGRTTMARRKMADFIQDTGAELFAPYSKKLNKQARRDKIRGIWESFLASLQSENNAELSRIEGFVVDDSVNAGNTPANLAQGIYWVQTKVRTLSSMDHIVLQTEIGPNAVITTEA